MPEGHTIHRLARDHRRQFSNRLLRVSSPQGRFRAGAKKLDRLVLTTVEAHGKHLFYRWENQSLLHVHLGLYGKFRSHRCPPPKPRGAVRLRIVGDIHAFDLNGPTICEIISSERVANLCRRLGPDPLRRDADPEQAWQRIRKSRASIGALLLDQSVISGVGNVYRAEVLFVNQIHPNRWGNSLSEQEFGAIWETLYQWLRIGVKYNRIITAHSKQRGKPGRLNGAERLLVYKKVHCPACGAEIKSWKLGSRKIYACDFCQS